MSNITDTFVVREPEDVERLRKLIPMLIEFTPFQTQALWERFSETWAASWLTLDEITVLTFKEWLQK